MKNRISKLSNVLCTIAVGLCSSQSLGGSPGDSAGDDAIAVHVEPDKRVYSPGEIMHATIAITNISDTPLYLFHGINQCSGPLGYLFLRIVDSHNKELPIPACTADFLMDELNIVQQLSDSHFGVLLRKNEIFGRVEDYKMSAEKGLSRLQAVIWEVGSLTQHQEKALSDHRMRILRHTCFSPVITVEVK